MPELSDVRVLATGDEEADLAVFRGALAVACEVAQGLGGAVSAMRLREFGALVADVGSVQDALALLRAARRSRPATRGIVLIPADQDPGRDGWELVARSAFAVLPHPVEGDTLARLIDDARRDYLAELRGVPVPARTGDEVDPEETRWLLAERRLAAVLRRTVTRWSTRSQGGAEDALLRGVEAMAEATRQAQGSPEVLLAIAEALGEGSARRDGEGTGEAA